MKNNKAKLKIISLAVFAAVIFIFGLFGWAKSSEAATYYVATNGSDSNPGTESQPWRNIQKAADTVAAGDIVYIKAGTYSGFKITNKHGTSDSWITFRANPGDTVTLDSYQNGYANTNHGIEINVGSYIEINGFKITDSNPTYNGTTFAEFSQGMWHNGVDITYGTSASYIKIYNNIIYRTGQHGIGISSTSTYFEIADNTLYDIGRSKRGYGVYVNGDYHTLRRNIIHDCYGYGIHVYGSSPNLPDNALIEKNKCYSNGHTDFGKGYEGYPPEGMTRGDGIIIWSGSGHTAQNNILYDNLESGIRVNASNVNVYNNTTYNNKKWAGIYIYDDKGAVVKNNIAYLNSPTNLFIGTGNIQNNNFTTDPKFFNAPNGDFHLLSNSPAIDAGASAGAPSTDFDDNVRPSPVGGAYDIGAYEYIGTSPDTTPPASPTGLTVN